MDKTTENLISQSIANTQTAQAANSRESNNPWFDVMVQASSISPAWWSPTRDAFLRNFWRQVNHLSIAVYNAQSKLAGIQPRVEARDLSISAHVELATEMTQRLLRVSEFGLGWAGAAEKFFLDLLTQDNGGFLEVLGDGSPDGPIVGLPYGVRHLDSSCCTRTGNPTYPVVYRDITGKRFKLHQSRVIAISQMRSPEARMNGVGLCAVSRAIDIAQALQDIVIYKQEKLGSRPISALLVGKGFRAKSIMDALRAANVMMDNSSLQRYSKIVAIGTDDVQADIDKLDLNGLDPFNEQTSTDLAMVAIAFAFGLDVSEIWISGASSSKADATLANARARGKLPAQTTMDLSTHLDWKFVPPYLRVVFDFKDDQEDQQKAIIKDIRGRNRSRDIKSKVVDARTARLQMLKDEDLFPNEFAEMEFRDGRLEDGSSIGILFYDPHPDYQELLKLNLDNPFNYAHNNLQVVQEEIAQARLRCFLASTRQSRASKDRVTKSLLALDWLEQQYKNHLQDQLQLSMDTTNPTTITSNS